MRNLLHLPLLLDKSNPQGAFVREASKGTYNRKRWIAVVAGLLVVVFTFALYLRTLAPTVLTYQVASYDAANLETKAHVLGIGHPTGYPTFIMLGKLFTYLPIGDIAYRVNLSSAVYGTLAVLFVYLIGLRLNGGGVVAASAAAIAFAVSKTFWSQSIIAEVYSLNALMIGATLYSLLLWRYRRRDRYLLLAAFMAGLALTDHLTSGLLIPSAIAMVFLVDRSKLTDLGLLAKAAGMFLIGLLPYLYLPVRASMNPPLNEGNPSNLYRFLQVVSGGNFKDKMFTFGPLELLHRSTVYLEHLYQQFPLVLTIVAVAGILITLSKDRAVLLLFGVLGATTLLYALEYNIPDIEEYFIPTYLLLAAWMAVGLGWMMEYTRAGIKRLKAPLQVRTLGVAISAVVLMLPLWNLSSTYRAVDLSHYYGGRKVLEAIEQYVPRDAVILNHRNFGVIHYAAYIYPGYKDLKLVDTGKFVEERTAAAVATGRPVYFLLPGRTHLGKLKRDGYDLVLVYRFPDGGALYRVLPPSSYDG